MFENLVPATRPTRQFLRAHYSDLSLRLSGSSRPFAAASRQTGPIVVTGLVNNSRGIGRSARAVIQALQSANYKVIAHDAAPLLFGGQAPSISPIATGGVWIIHLNPPEMRRVLQLTPLLARAPMLRVGFWYWELPRAPHNWLNSARYLNEVWTATRFSSSAMSKQPYAEVRTMTFPFTAPKPVAPDRKKFGMPSDAIVFLSMADARSSLARKNPAGAILAYRKAFPSPDGKTALFVKLLGAEGFAPAVASLRAAAMDRPDIMFFTQTLDEAEVDTLLASVDILVSLHRSEGLGLTPAEAMALGKAVILTPWSGVEDFIAPDAVAAVAFSMTSVKDAQGIYHAPSQVWAEPDLDDAAHWMARLAGEPDLRKSMGERAREQIIKALPSVWPETSFSSEFRRLAEKSA